MGVQIAETRAEITSLKHNLTYSAEDASIIVEPFLSFATGKGLSSSFEAEYHSNIGTMFESGSYLAQRHKHLPGSTEGLIHNCFLPSGPDLNTRLCLSKDFAYWPPCYKEEGADIGPAVFVTISSILQQAREKKFLNQENRLNTDAFQQVVLAPENFARYNDGIIQAALLRAAHPSELDYSTYLHVMSLLTFTNQPKVNSTTIKLIR